FISDAVRRSAAADFGLHNPGGVRADLPSGPVSYNDLYRVLPFGNEVIRLEVTGRQLRQLVNQVNARYYFSNLRISRTSDASSGSQAITVSFSDGTPIVDEQSYTLATNSFLADGGDGLAILQTLSREVVGISLLDAVVDQLRMLPAPVRLPL
ncbi:MAG: 5'-nucleotidase, partial [Pseudomonadales bacterium]